MDKQKTKLVVVVATAAAATTVNFLLTRDSRVVFTKLHFKHRFNNTRSTEARQYASPTFGSGDLLLSAESRRKSNRRPPLCNSTNVIKRCFCKTGNPIQRIVD